LVAVPEAYVVDGEGRLVSQVLQPVQLDKGGDSFWGAIGLVGTWAFTAEKNSQYFLVLAANNSDPGEWVSVLEVDWYNPASKTMQKLPLPLQSSTTGSMVFEIKASVPSAGLAEGAHSLTATSTDAVGNVGAAASLTSFTVDTQAPDTSITLSPPALALSGEASFEFSSNEAQVSYECSVDEESFTPCPDTYSFAPGVHTLKVRAVDVAGNADPSPAEYTWTVRLPLLAGRGCSAAPWPAAWLALLALVVLRRRARCQPRS